MRPMEGVSTSTAGFIGMAEKGNVIGTPEFVSSFADFTRKFGSYLSETEFGKYRYLAYAVEQFFANGGTRCYVMRTVAADATTAEVSANGVTIKAKNPGKWGNEIKIAAVAANKGKTAVLEATGEDATGKVYTVANGSLFAEGDTIVIRNNDKVIGYNKIAMAQGNTITLATPVKEDLVDKGAVPKKTLSVCEMNIEVSYRAFVECIVNGIRHSAEIRDHIIHQITAADRIHHCGLLSGQFGTYFPELQTLIIAAAAG